MKALRIMQTSRNRQTVDTHRPETQKRQCLSGYWNSVLINDLITEVISLIVWCLIDGIRCNQTGWGAQVWQIWGICECRFVTLASSEADLKMALSVPCTALFWRIAISKANGQILTNAQGGKAIDLANTTHNIKRIWSRSGPWVPQ